MEIQIIDIDDWKAADFIRYIKSICVQKGIEYNADSKQAYMVLGRTFKLLKLNNKSKSWLKKQIDMFLNTETMTEVRSLLFLNYLTRTFPHQIRNTLKNLPKVTGISSKVKKRLIMLKSVYAE